MYAIIETGGKQFKVSEGDTITVEKLDASVGENYTFDRVLAVVTDNGGVFGTPFITGATVDASVTVNGKAKKVIIYKYKSKKGFHKKKGHRQPFTNARIIRINPSSTGGADDTGGDIKE